MIITAPSLDTKKNVSGVSSVVRFIIDNNPGRRYIHFELGRQDNERRGPRRLLSLTKALWEWKKLLSKNTEALVHYSFPLSAPSILRDPLFMWTAKRKGHRMVVHIHGGLFLNAERTPWLLRKILKWVFSWDVPFIVLSDKEREILMDKFSAKNVEILPNCVSIPEEDNYTHKEQRRHDGIIMGYLGRIEGNKGMRELLEACKRLKEEGVDFKLRFAGKEQKEGEFIPEYKNALGGNFEYVGLVSGKTKELFMRNLDIFIMPTYFEGLPMSLLECMSYAITPVVTPVGSIPTVVDSIDTTTRDTSGKYNLEAVTEGMDGVFIKKQDVRSIIDAVKLLYDNREMTRKLGLNARKRIIQEFSPNEYIEKLNSIYTKANLRK